MVKLRFFLTCVATCLYSIALHAQDGHMLHILIRNSENTAAYLHSYYGDRTIFVDSTRADRSGNIIFFMAEENKPGMYQVRFSNNKVLNLMYHEEDIYLSTDINSPVDSLIIYESEENRIYYDYMNLSQEVLYQLSILEPVLDYYPRNTDFFSAAANEAERLVKKEQDFVRRIRTEHPNSLATRYILFTRSVLPDPLLPPHRKNTIRKSDFFRDRDFMDTLLLQTNAITGKVIEYLSFYRNQQYNFDEQETAFINAVDSILLPYPMHEDVFAMIVQYLVRGFEQFKFERALNHIYETYIPMISCTDESVKNNLEKRLAQYSKIVPGVMAPDFRMNDLNGTPVHLYDHPADKILLVFWASWCPHCEQELDRLKKMTSDRQAVPEVIAISVDKEEGPWRESIADNGYNWINCAELQGWGGPVISSYYIYATPTFILVGPDKKIIAKSGTLKEISKFF